MTSPKLQALLVENDEGDLRTLGRLVRGGGFEVTGARTVEEARESLEKSTPDLALVDLDLPDDSASALVDELRAGSDAEVVLVTAEGSIDSAVDALHAGVFDYLTSPVDEKRLERVLAAVRRARVRDAELAELRSDLRRFGRFGRMVGSSPAMQEVYDLLGRVARTSSTVLLTGETGTGKDLIAETVHRMSKRSERPFVAVNCGAIQPSLIESELFGHTSGSFTGASRARKGLFEQAQGGTLFLDEITEMSPDLQVKLLRVLETRAVRRVGAEKAIDVDVRLVAATNRPPEAVVEKGDLREDLFYRLNVFPIRVPPLRDRGDDVGLLAGYFLDDLNEQAGESKRLDPATLDALGRHDWPGNVRELRNVVERAFILAADVIRPEHVVLHRGRSAPADGAVPIQIGTSIAEAEQRLIVATLEHLDGDKKRAAEALGISLKTLYNRLNSYGLGRRGKKTGKRRKAPAR